MSNNIPTLEEVDTLCWQRLQAAVRDAGHPWRLPVLATASTETDGSVRVKQRTVVLREASGALKQLAIHTDIRSPKIAHIQHNPNVSLCFYSPGERIQVTLTATASIHTDDTVADAMWHNSPESSLRMYLGLTAPGSALNTADSNLPADIRGRVPTRNELSAGRCNFAAIRFLVTGCDWLRLTDDGNLRCRLKYSDETATESVWIAP